jgi:hypothetical protein
MRTPGKLEMPRTLLRNTAIPPSGVLLEMFIKLSDSLTIEGGITLDKAQIQRYKTGFVMNIKKRYLLRSKK